MLYPVELKYTLKLKVSYGLLLKGILLLPVELNLLYYRSSYFSPKLLFFCSSILIALIGVPVNA